MSCDLSLSLDAEELRLVSPPAVLEDRTSVPSFADRIAITACWMGSYLTDPICKSHECFRRIYIVDALHPTASGAAHVARKVFLALGLIGWASLAVMTTLPGTALRSLGSYLQSTPFIHIRAGLASKHLPPDHSFTLLSWNICGVSGGYSISDGGVLPWSLRIDAIIQKILEKDADVNCLYEVFDVKTAFYLCERLKRHGYTHFYFNMGPRAVGVSSGMFVASKYNMTHTEFVPFPQDSVTGRGKYAAKGVFSFDLESRGKSFARIHATHLQHSEEPQFPTADEVAARRKQMQFIVDKVYRNNLKNRLSAASAFPQNFESHSRLASWQWSLAPNQNSEEPPGQTSDFSGYFGINRVRDRCMVVTGDLNLDDEEYRASPWRTQFFKGDRFGNTVKTWGGDAFCANLVGKRASAPSNLDHTMIVRGTARSLSTSLIETGYDPARFTREALSDHGGLLSHITV